MNIVNCEHKKYPGLWFHLTFIGIRGIKQISNGLTIGLENSKFDIINAKKDKSNIPPNPREGTW